MPPIYRILILCLLLSACSHEPVVSKEMMHVDGPLPANFSGSWQRNYARDDDINSVLQRTYDDLVRSAPDPGMPGADMSSILPLARLAELITRPDVLTISQTDHEIFVERKDDFSLSCEFYNGQAKVNASEFGTETCGWIGAQLVSNLVLPRGLQVTHRFDISEDGQQLRVVTTVSSSTSRFPFSLRRFYTKFAYPRSEFNCIETLSRKRVCSTGEIKP